MPPPSPSSHTTERFGTLAVGGALKKQAYVSPTLQTKKTTIRKKIAAASPLAISEDSKEQVTRERTCLPFLGGEQWIRLVRLLIVHVK